MQGFLFVYKGLSLIPCLGPTLVGLPGGNFCIFDNKDKADEDLGTFSDVYKANKLANEDDDYYLDEWEGPKTNTFHLHCVDCALVETVIVCQDRLGIDGRKAEQRGRVVVRRAGAAAGCLQCEAGREDQRRRRWHWHTRADVSACARGCGEHRRQGQHRLVWKGAYCHGHTGIAFHVDGMLLLLPPPPPPPPPLLSPTSTDWRPPHTNHQEQAPPPTEPVPMETLAAASLRMSQDPEAGKGGDAAEEGTPPAQP
jgi:hypothetical protein